MKRLLGALLRLPVGYQAVRQPDSSTTADDFAAIPHRKKLKRTQRC